MDGAIRQFGDRSVQTIEARQEGDQTRKGKDRKPKEEVLSRQLINKLNIHRLSNQCTEDDLAFVRELKERLTTEYLLAHEPWNNIRLPPEYIQSDFMAPPVLFFGIGFNRTAEDVLSLAQKLNVPEPTICGKNHSRYLDMVLLGVEDTINKKLGKSPWRIKFWGILSPNTNLTRVMSLTDNSLTSLSNKGALVDDMVRFRSVEWDLLEDTAQALHELTRRDPMWHIGNHMHNEDWESRKGYSAFGM
ncbi:hypothetical protein CONPUDRAFT_168095 [Coniophora puteana RWD-64-598 SS2]|uniref:Uncharacterized protein n=1 Tax=Coniophora puteana (strain RWD-64-598) TaxID=741705 RepID=A0A5M3MD91_CONPW|nr:uncharacterized protein CONPUDRAFT_168095 [Coniophora puteana RWD-64-598 SS2]EIW77073.1 hypothetical protein CONPUDRAFT_168095 [Coniophora puteana RWD-64-598 SS2]